MATAPEQVEARSVTGGRMALVVGTAVLLLALVWLLWLRGEGEVEPAGAVAPAAVEVAEAEAAPEPAAAPTGRVETFEVFAAKDPFMPVVRPAPAGGAAEPSAESPDEPGAAGGTGTAGGDRAGASEEIGGHRVRLVSTFRRNGRPRAQVQVDSTVYTVSEGETFADNFKLLSISGDCATLLYGDDQFTLCEGEEILK